MSAAILIASANSVTSGAVLTLVLPLGLTLIALVLGFIYFRRDSSRRARGE